VLIISAGDKKLSYFKFIYYIWIVNWPEFVYFEHDFDPVFNLKIGEL